MSIHSASRTGVVLLCLSFLACLTCWLIPHFSGRRLSAAPGTYSAPQTESGMRPGTAARLAGLPLSFEANVGQIDPRVKFLSRGAGHSLFLTADEAIVSFDRAALGHPAAAHARAANQGLGEFGLASMTGSRRRTGGAVSVLRLKFVGANPWATADGVGALPGKSNYFHGSNTRGWRTGAAHYAQVRYRGIYPGVDLVYYGHQGQLEYDLILRPGVDPGSIRLALKGDDAPGASRPGEGGDAQRGGRESRRAMRGGRSQGQNSQFLRIAADGDLVIRVAGGEVRLRRPQAYQTDAGGRPESSPAAGKKLIEARYVIRSPGTIAFKLGAYDASRPLVIDPVLAYSTYLGGSDDDEGFGIAVDGSGNLYVAGQTASLDFPVTGGAFQPANAGSSDVFVTKLDPTGTQLIYSTYLGGSGFDSAEGIAVDSSGNAYLTGTTCSIDFPTTPGAFQIAYAGDKGNCELYGGDAFVTKLDPAGSALVYSTYLGSAGSDIAFGIAVNAAGNAYVTGMTAAGNFPATPNAFQHKIGGEYDAFVTEFRPDGSRPVYSTFLGGLQGDIAYTIALDSSGNAYVAGFTDSKSFPVTGGAFETRLRGPTAGFVTKLSASGSAALYSTFLGGSGAGVNPCATCITGIAVDSAGSAYISGLTWETNFPVTAGAFQRTFAGGEHDAFVAHLKPSGAALSYATYLGGTGDDGAVSIAIDGSGNAYLRGNTFSTDFPVTANAFQSSSGGGSDAFVAQVNPGATKLLYSTYFGGSGDEFGKAVRSLALVGASNPLAYITGYTDSTDLPVTSGAFQPAYGGGTNDAFVAEFSFGAHQGLLPGGPGRPAKSPQPQVPDLQRTR